jgi:AcrR family transcriptional regulator
MGVKNTTELNGGDTLSTEGLNKRTNTEQAILEAAMQEFMENGFEAAKTTKIAALAGVTHAMLHYYYRTKENLFNKVFDQKINLMKYALFLFFEMPDIPFLEKVRRSIESHFDFLKDNPGLTRFVVNELIFKPKRLALFEDKISEMGSHALNRLSEEIEAEVKRGTICPIEPANLLINIASLNVFVFLALPVLRIFAVRAFGNEEAFLEARKKENVEVIMRRLRRIDNGQLTMENLQWRIYN